jgi:hypothetical protein
MEGETSAPSGTPLTAKISGLSFLECKLGETSCTTSTTTPPSTAKIEATKAHNGTLALGGAKFSFVCGALLNCAYSAFDLEFNGGSPATLAAKKAIVTKVGGLFCPAVAELDITYAISTPKAVFVE